MLLGKELYSKEVLLILFFFFFFMKVTWGHNSCQRPGNPCYDKKRLAIFGYPRQENQSLCLA